MTENRQKNGPEIIALASFGHSISVVSVPFQVNLEAYAGHKKVYCDHVVGLRSQRCSFKLANSEAGSS